MGEVTLAPVGITSAWNASSVADTAGITVNDGLNAVTISLEAVSGITLHSIDTGGGAGNINVAGGGITLSAGQNITIQAVKGSSGGVENGESVSLVDLLPKGGVVIGGEVTVGSSSGSTEWSGFSIGEVGGTTNQSAHTSEFLAQASGGNFPEIFGKADNGGPVFLLKVDGTIYGALGILRPQRATGIPLKSAPHDANGIGGRPGVLEPVVPTATVRPGLSFDFNFD